MQVGATGVCTDEAADEIWFWATTARLASSASGFSGMGKLVLHVLVQRPIELVDQLHQLTGVLLITRRLGQLSPIMTIHFSHACPPGRFERPGLPQLVCQSAWHVFSLGYGNKETMLLAESRKSYLPAFL
jgi:hypothetical protein